MRIWKSAGIFGAYYKTKYVRLPDMLLELDLARTDGTYKKVQAKYANPVLLIIDEWLLLKPTEAEQHDILELAPQKTEEILHDLLLPVRSQRMVRPARWR